jgi:predicted permease
MSVLLKAILTMLLVAVATAAGYGARRRGWVQESASHGIMTVVAVVGYPLVGFLSVWRIALTVGDLLMPAVAMVQVIVLTAIALAAAPLLLKDKPQRGLLAMAAASGNWGFTMGAFVVYLMFGVDALGWASIYCIMFTPAMVLVMYPVARHYTSDGGESLGKLMLHSLLDVRSIGLVGSVAGIALALGHVKYPAALENSPLLDVLMLAIMPVAYFSIGLRLHPAGSLALWRLMTALGVMRFIVSPIVAIGMLWVLDRTAWSMTGLPREVFLLQAFVPTAVTMVAVANMFHLRPREGSLLFVTNTVAYLVVALPLLLWRFG